MCHTNGVSVQLRIIFFLSKTNAIYHSSSGQPSKSTRGTSLLFIFGRKEKRFGRFKKKRRENLEFCAIKNQIKLFRCAKNGFRNGRNIDIGSIRSVAHSPSHILLVQYNTKMAAPSSSSSSILFDYFVGLSFSYCVTILCVFLIQNLSNFSNSIHRQVA